MKPKTFKIIPPEIHNFILNSFNKKEKRTTITGNWSFIPDLTRAVNEFIKQNEERFPLYTTKFHNNISKDLIKRAFNIKSPNGATKSLRDLLAHYSTDGKQNWNKLIITSFSEYTSLLDEPKFIENNEQQKISLKDIHNELVEIKRIVTKYVKLKM